MHRSQYLHARQTLARLLELGVVPVVNENDAVADEEIRFGDNDRLAALVAHLVGAELLVLLTDTAGLLTEDPRRTAAASLIEEVVEIDHELERIAGGPGIAVGSGGMASKLAAAKIAVWSGVEAVIADASRPGVLAAVTGGAGGGHAVPAPRPPAPGPQAVDRLRHRGLGDHRGRRRGPPGAGRARAAPCCRPAWCPCPATSVPTRRWRSPGPTATVFAKGLVRQPGHRGGRVGRAAARTSSPRTSPPRWSTGTTWWCWLSGRPGPGRTGPPGASTLDGACSPRRLHGRNWAASARRRPAGVLARASSAARDEALLRAADLIEQEADRILGANADDVERAERAGADATSLDRLRLDAARVAGDGRRPPQVAALADPVGEVVDGWVRPNGLRISRVRVPLGVVGIIYENRPNVTSDAAGLCLKSGNAVLLRGSSSAIASNPAIAAAPARRAGQGRPAGGRRRPGGGHQPRVGRRVHAARRGASTA